MSTSATSTSWVHKTSASRTTIILLSTMIVAVILNSAVAALAKSAGVGHGFAPLTLPVYGSFTIIGILVGWFGWRLVQRRAAHPSRVLRILVPVVGLLTFTPDVLLMTLRYLPGASVGAAIALMAMHIVVIATAVPAYMLASPTPR